MALKKSILIVVKMNKLEIQIVKFVKNYSTGLCVYAIKNKYYN